PTVQSKPPCTRPMTLLTRSFNYLKLHENVAQLLSENENVRIYIVYCDTGQRSAAAAFLLTGRGLNVYVLDGGLAAAQPSRD
ncbi:MAG: rhodanese-like domain-containing protein, partial [Gammaproteobacteria bacterium]